MSPILVLSLSATLLVPVTPARPTVSSARAPLLTQMARMAGAPAAWAPEAPAARPPRGGDSLKNGAITGAVIAGGAMAWWANRGCEEGFCSDTLLWTGLAAGLGALAGAGLDALFDR